MKRIELIQGDLTKVKVNAVVNAANSSLLGGGGVDGAIHRAAGPGLVLECLMLKGCKTGAAKLTKGYQLPAKYIIHTVGPVWRGGEHGEAELLAACYRTSLQLAVEYQLKSIAFPAISTGIYRFPKESASRIALSEIKQHLAGETSLERVLIVCYDQENYQVYQNLLEMKEY